MKSRRRSTSCQDKCNATPSWQSLLNRFGLIVLVSHYFFILIFCYITLRPEETHEKFTQEICRYTWLTRKCQLPKHHTQSVQGSVIIRDGQKALIRSPRMPPKLEAFLHAGKKKKKLTAFQFRFPMLAHTTHGVSTDSPRRSWYSHYKQENQCTEIFSLPLLFILWIAI